MGYVAPCGRWDAPPTAPRHIPKSLDFMKITKDLLIVVICSFLFVIAAWFAIDNYSDDERNVYVAYFRHLSDVNNHNIAFNSAVTTCGVNQSDLNTISSDLVTNFFAANSAEVEPNDLSIYTSMVNVVDYQYSLMAHKSRYSPTGIGNNVIASISKTGFNDKKNKALLCVKTNHSARVYLFGKDSTGQWRFDKEVYGWVN